ncbi:hypothetical protein, partial [Microbispora siamensis]|uniref:hypothetical protein n=1 Tax=Microbispora siamensis TaxID=564413 RepID=UPI0019510599
MRNTRGHNAGTGDIRPLGAAGVGVFDIAGGVGAAHVTRATHLAEAADVVGLAGVVGASGVAGRVVAGVFSLAWVSGVGVAGVVGGFGVGGFGVLVGRVGVLR